MVISAFTKLNEHKPITLHKSSKETIDWLDSIEKIIYNGFYIYQNNLNKIFELIQKYNFCPFVKICFKEKINKNIAYNDLVSIIEYTPCEIFYRRYDYNTFLNILRISLEKYPIYSFIYDYL